MTLYFCCAAALLAFILGLLVLAILFRRAPIESYPGQYG